MKQQTVSLKKGPAKSHGACSEKIPCNLCGRKFRPRSKLVRFCNHCREESEEYHFGADWMPIAV